MKVMTQLAFKGQCRQAFELYEEVLGGKITVMNTFGDFDAKLPPGSTASAPDQIRFAELQVGGYAILGNDLPEQDYKPTRCEAAGIVMSRLLATAPTQNSRAPTMR